MRSTRHPPRQGGPDRHARVRRLRRPPARKGREEGRQGRGSPPRRRQGYELLIQDIGKKGDGIGELDQYGIYVPGAAKGGLRKVFLREIAGHGAFGRRTSGE